MATRLQAVLAGWIGIANAARSGIAMPQALA